MRWPWRRKVEEQAGNGHAAKKAKADAAAAVKAAAERWPEVHHVSNVFAAQVEAALRRSR